jgi:hypothetical protein
MSRAFSVFLFLTLFVEEDKDLGVREGTMAGSGGRTELGNREYESQLWSLLGFFNGFLMASL